MRNVAITKHMEQMCTGYVTTKLKHGPSTRKGCARDISDKQINQSQTLYGKGNGSREKGK